MKFFKWFWSELKNRSRFVLNERGIIATSTAIIAAAVVGAGTAVYASGQAKKQQEAALESAEQQGAAQRAAEERAIALSKMTPEEKAYQSMLMKYSQGQLETAGAEIEGKTEAETEKAMESLQKYYMQRGWQPSPQQTGLLIEPSQAAARDIAVQNALLRKAGQETAYQQAAQLYPQQQRAIEQSAGQYVSAPTEPYRTQQAYASSAYDEAIASQKAFGSMLQAYSSPLLQSRMQQPSKTSIIPGQGSQYAGAGGGYASYTT